MSPALPVIKLVEPAVGEITNVLCSQVSAEEIAYSKGNKYLVESSFSTVQE